MAEATVGTSPVATPHRWDARSLVDSLWFPVAVWAVWRLAQLIILVAVSGHPVGDTFRFDAAWYRSILSQGYHFDLPSTVQQNVAFPPGLPWLTEPFSWVLGDKWAAFLVANATGLGAFVAVWWALRDWAGDRCARYGTVALALWPTSFYLWAFYSEGLFLIATAVGLTAQRRGNRLLAAACIVVAGVTRVVGFAFGPVLAVAHWWHKRRLDLTGFVYLASSAVAALLVSGAQQITTGHAFAAQEVQTDAWHLGAAPPWTPIIDAVRTVVDKLPHVAHETLLNLVAVFVVGAAVVALLVLARRGRWAWEPPLWAAVAFGVPLCIKVVSSQSRYALAVWPALALAGLGKGPRTRWLRGALALASVALTVLLLRRWTTGGFIA